MTERRKEITKFLNNLLVTSRLNGIGKYYASEVTIDYGKGKGNTKRIDFVQFIPKNQLSISGIEHGHFVAYEIKSCKEDFNSGFGKNFICEKNYIVTTMRCYKDIMKDIPWDVGVIVPCFSGKSETDEFENPTIIGGNIKYWNLKIVKQAHSREREKSLAEMLFYMLRSGRN